MTTPEAKQQPVPKGLPEQASREQILKLIEDIRKITPWYDREPMGQA